VAAGIFVYDCSGFAVAAWLRAGVDLITKSASWSDAIYFNLPQVSVEQALPGDLVLFGQDTTDPADGEVTDHVGLYVDAHHTLQSGGGCPTGAGGLSVCVRSIDWSHVVAIARAW
jgi:cell wall-associated NlpC family hydrolase